MVLPTYDRQSFLAESVNSVLGQTMGDFELIVVDDGSPTPAEVPDEPRVRLLRHDSNRGIAAARNSGLDAATGEYVCFLDDDDIFDPRRLEMVASQLERAPIVLCWASYLGQRDTGRVLEGHVAGALLADTAPPLGATTVRRSDALRLDETYAAAEDVEWWVRMSSTPVVTVPEIGYWVRKHQGARTNHGTSARIASSVRLLEMHDDYFERHRAAAAFRWKRIGLMYAALGNQREATRSFVRSLRLRPDVRTLRHLLRSSITSHFGERDTSAS